MNRRVLVSLCAMAGIALVLAFGALHGSSAGAQARPISRATSADKPNPDAVERGRKLFATGCASCHGANGRGTNLGPDLHGRGAASADFQLSTGRMPASQATGAQAVRKPPAYPRKQIDDLVAYVASIGGGPPVPDVKNPRGSTVTGGERYRSVCAACHSSAANGGALSLGRDAPDLHESTPVEVAEAIRTGPGNMPVFGTDTLDNREVNSIVRYVQYLRRPQNPGGLSLGLVGPITEGLVAILIGLGALMLATRWIEPSAMRKEVDRES